MAKQESATPARNARCYYCGGAGCSECRKITSSSYGADALPQDPSPNGKNPCVEVKVSTVLGRSAEEIYQELKKHQPKTPPKKQYGFISKQQMRIGRTVVYRRPDGSEIEVSFVADTPDAYQDTGFTDMVCIGEVTEFVRVGKGGMGQV